MTEVDEAFEALHPQDLEEVFVLWPGAVTSPRWRLGGTSPSPGLLHRLTTDDVALQWVLRDEQGRVAGLYQLCEVDERSRSAHLGFVLDGVGGASGAALALPFLEAASARLGLGLVVVQIDQDVADGFRDLIPHLDLVGSLRERTRRPAGGYQDRLVYEFRPVPRPEG
jgi:hypothetical protein